MERNYPVALLAITHQGYLLGETLRDGLHEKGFVCTLHGYRPRIEYAEHPFDDMGERLKALFLKKTALIGLAPASVLIRLIAPLLKDKYSEPPLLALDEEGRYIQPLLGGHHGGHRLARAMADIIDGVALITNASDHRLDFALDDPPKGWKISALPRIKKIMGDLLAGEKVTLLQETQSAWPPQKYFVLLRDSFENTISKAALYIGARATPSSVSALHPPLLTLGIGCVRGTSHEEIDALIEKVFQKNTLSRKAIAGIASIDIKRDEMGLISFAEKHSLPLRFFSAETLAGFSDKISNPSTLVLKETGSPSVAEASSLALAGPSATLLVTKDKSEKVTCAISLSSHPLDITNLAGKKLGRLALVGLGPGGQDWRTAEAESAFQDADTLIGYSLYLDLIRPYAKKTTIFLPYPIGAESERCRKALDLASLGQNVALVCSGDPGIYAMAALVFELLDSQENPEWRFCPIHVCPGISAMQFLSARIGAPLGHDFCALSLSDLLTPRDIILNRAMAAAKSDFVTSLYNPQSKNRHTLLKQVLDIFKRHRPKDTPVICGRLLGREGEKITVASIDDFDPDIVDMFSTVIIGSRQSRLFERFSHPAMYTPRGYAKKNNKEPL